MRPEAHMRPLTREDLVLIDPVVADPFERAAIAYRLTLDGPNIGIWWQETLAAVGGFQVHHAGVAEPWLVFTPHGKAHLRPVYRAIVQWLRQQIVAYQLHRLQGIARFDNEGSQRLLQHLGFTYEGTCRQFGPDRSDYYWYAWVRPKEE